MTEPITPNAIPAARHCWADYRASLEYLSDEWLRVTVEEADATCLLPAGHAGPHVWSLDRELVIEFRELPEAPR